MTTAVTELSAFFPAHDEAANLEATVDAALTVLKGLALREFDVIVVDDGSTDGTSAIADELAERHDSVRVIHHDTNRGYGAALQSGLTAARLEWIFYSDSDCQFDLSELALLLPFAEENDAVIGYRANRSEGVVRKVNQFLWTRVVRALVGLNVRDVDCAFKLLRRSSVEAIRPLASEGAVISAELLVKLQRAGARIKQVPVTHHPRPAGRPSGGSPRVIARAFRELFRLRRRLRSAG
ncbi:MAG: glycosyltransferase family 2 protein [Actinomycetota bacterium]